MPVVGGLLYDRCAMLRDALCYCKVEVAKLQAAKAAEAPNKHCMAAWAAQGSLHTMAAHAQS